MEDLEKAKKELFEGGYTCVLRLGEERFISEERGIRPLLGWLENGSVCSGFSAADKVVGRAAAFLYVLLGAKAVFADVMSEPAKEVLAASGIACSYNRLVPAIRNRTDTGFCPMESAVREISEPEAALAAVRKKLKELSQKSE